MKKLLPITSILFALALSSFSANAAMVRGMPASAENGGGMAHSNDMPAGPIILQINFDPQGSGRALLSILGGNGGPSNQPISVPQSVVDFFSALLASAAPSASQGNGNAFGPGGQGNGNGNAFGPGGQGNGNGNAFGPGVAPVPIPAAVWLFGSALLGLFGMQKFSRSPKQA